MNLSEIENFNKDNVLALVLAGGEGSRLHPLTRHQSKPSVPFGLDNRIVDFVVSNLLNSGIKKIYLIAQYKPESLIEHVKRQWGEASECPEGFIRVVCPRRDSKNAHYRGTADAVAKNLGIVEQHDPELIAVFSADHIYRMDVREMIRFHLDNKADASIAAMSVSRDRAHLFGILGTDASSRINEFQEKPLVPRSLPFDSTMSYASMGNYVFSHDVFRDVIKRVIKYDYTDFGHHVLGWLIRDFHTMAYDFSNNRIPGLKNYEISPYWYDVGTLDAYWRAHQDILGNMPSINLMNPSWPIGCREHGYKDTESYQHANSLISADVECDNAIVRGSVVRSNVVLEEGAVVEDSIILGDVVVRKGVKLKRVVVDQYNVIDKNTVIGFDADEDRRQYHVDKSGIVVIPRGIVGDLIDKRREALRSLSQEAIV